ncbi:hypothetical protein IVA79_24770 [Bradyrhizobium sp. 138]|uniref:hypothetical protein n=1 Tax=Bradyrhizobium sp. 138 TaxID=2782615 RepID=UPI001FF8050D|nr:hypothetical protein [Bradyrhizobium sp. 138]MCK1737098.1 hypothetical protein [Bradyrhizobium sp. 138]
MAVEISASKFPLSRRIGVQLLRCFAIAGLNYLFDLACDLSLADMMRQAAAVAVVFSTVLAAEPASAGVGLGLSRGMYAGIRNRRFWLHRQQSR